MPQANISKAIPLATPHESTNLRPARDADDPRQAWKRLSSQRGQVMNDANSLQQLIRKVEMMRRRILGGGQGGSGWDWAYPDHKELDTTLSYPKGKFVYISALNTLVTAGMTDIISNATVVSCEGYWYANQDIPAATGGKFNMPVFPYPSGLGATAPSGTPLMGDLDTLSGSLPAIYWIYFGQVAC